MHVRSPEQVIEVGMENTGIRRRGSSALGHATRCATCRTVLRAVARAQAPTRVDGVQPPPPGHPYPAAEVSLSEIFRIVL
jgi:hypothetical protein